MRADRLTLVILLLWLMVVSVAVSCEAKAEPHGMQSVTQIAEGLEWQQTEKPKTTIIFVVGNPADICKLPVQGCEQHLQNVSVITFARPWYSVPINLLIHELMHSAGYTHK